MLNPPLDKGLFSILLRHKIRRSTGEVNLYESIDIFAKSKDIDAKHILDVIELKCYPGEKLLKSVGWEERIPDYREYWPRGDS